MEKITPTKKRLVLAIMVLFSIVFAVSTYFDLMISFYASNLLIIAVFFVLYLYSNKTENFFLSLFLLVMTVSETAYFIHFFYENTILSYFASITNTIAYICLFNHVIVDLKLSILLKKYKLHLMVALSVGVYGFMLLNTMLFHHDNIFKDFFSLMDLCYNLFIVLVFVFSFLNYAHKSSKKALILFLACLCIVVSEFLWIFSLFSSEKVVFSITIMLLKLAGFYCVYNYLMYKSVNPDLNELNL